MTVWQDWRGIRYHGPWTGRLSSIIHDHGTWAIGWLGFNVPFQHKYGYIRHEPGQLMAYLWQHGGEVGVECNSPQWTPFGCIIKVWVCIIHVKFNFPFKLGLKVGLHVVHKCILHLRFYGVCLDLHSLRAVYIVCCIVATCLSISHHWVCEYCVLV